MYIVYMFVVLTNVSFASTCPGGFSHELSHELYRNMSDKEKIKFQKEMSWEWNDEVGKKSKAGWTLKREKYVADDSEVAPEEDFANGIEHYVHELTRLKFKDPAMYRWIERNFGDKLRLE